MTQTQSVSVGSKSMDANHFGLGGTRPYMIGVGGCGMSALARLLAAAGLDVVGSDETPNPATGTLADAGIQVGFDQTEAAIPEDRDLIIASAAIRPDHPQLLEAQQRGLPVLSYPEGLGRVMAASTGVAIAGTHGKSTTTAMLGCALTDAGLDPAVIVGASCSQLAGGSLAPSATAAGFRPGAAAVPAGPYAGQPGLLLAEACEFNRSFHNLRPKVASIGTIEADHLDIYASLDEIIDAFTDFARLIPSKANGGRLLIAHEGAHRTRVAAGLECSVETIGFNPSADWVVGFDPTNARVTVAQAGTEIGSWTNHMPGEHNASNSATAFALGVMLGADPAKLAESLAAFTGLDRRMQFKGEVNAVRVYDDYGHHPTEIEATLKAVRQSDDPAKRDGRLICVFQPHQHSRTRFLMEQFATSFSLADIVIVPEIYFVRDSQLEKHKVSAGDLVERLRDRGVRAMHLHPFAAIVEQLENLCQPGDVLLVMGAGPVWQIAEQFLEVSSP